MIADDIVTVVSFWKGPGGEVERIAAAQSWLTLSAAEPELLEE